jgi:hypothetical protein
MVITPTIVFSSDDPHRPIVKITRRRPIADDIERTEPWGQHSDAALNVYTLETETVIPLT